MKTFEEIIKEEVTHFIEHVEWTDCDVDKTAERVMRLIVRQIVSIDTLVYKE